MKGKAGCFLSVILLGFCLNSPAIHADTLYVTTGSSIEEFNTGGGTGSVFSSGGWGALALSPGGTLYAAGPENTIYKFDSNGNASLFANSGLDSPDGLAFDDSGDLFVPMLRTIP
jgi:hypothetical protein